MHRLEQQRTECRCQRQGHKRRDQHRHGNGDGKLLIQPPHNAGNEAYRHKHRGQNKRDGNNRGRNLPHGGGGCLFRRLAFVDIHLHRFDHHNGIIDHDTNGQHKRKKGQGVDGKPQRHKKRERTDDGYRNGQQRNERSPPALQEQEYHQNNQHQGLDQSLEHLRDRHLNDRHRFEGHYIFNIFREGSFQIVHRGIHTLGRSQCITTGQLIHQQVRRPLAIDKRVAGVREFAQLHPRYIFQPHQRARRRVAAHDDFPKIVFFAQSAIGKDRVLEGLRGRLRRSAHRPTRHLQVLLLQRRHYLVGRHAQLGQPVGLEPDAHTEIIGPAKNITYPRYPQQRIPNVDIRVVVQKRDAVRTLRRVHSHQHKQRRVSFPHHHPQPGYFLRQLRLRNAYAVLHVERGNIHIGAHLEGHVHAHAPIIGGVGLHVVHAGCTVHLGLDGRSHGLFHRLRVGTGIRARYLHHRGRDVGVLADRQTE